CVCGISIGDRWMADDRALQLLCEPGIRPGVCGGLLGGRRAVVSFDLAPQETRSCFGHLRLHSWTGHYVRIVLRPFEPRCPRVWHRHLRSGGLVHPGWRAALATREPGCCYRSVCKASLDPDITR